ncbi:hypothetical protein BC830DRAFT_1128381 [Chytriomyces sp. MP71]|nr:hypothetical protein BC830DRAFT_1128381 [Chytriomyces sp. MP71]
MSLFILFFFGLVLLSMRSRHKRDALRRHMRNAFRRCKRDRSNRLDTPLASIFVRGHGNIQWLGVNHNFRQVDLVGGRVQFAHFVELDNLVRGNIVRDAAAVAVGICRADLFYGGFTFPVPDAVKRNDENSNECETTADCGKDGHKHVGSVSDLTWVVLGTGGGSSCAAEGSSGSSAGRNSRRKSGRSSWNRRRNRGDRGGSLQRQAGTHGSKGSCILRLPSKQRLKICTSACACNARREQGACTSCGQRGQETHEGCRSRAHNYVTRVVVQASDRTLGRAAQCLRQRGQRRRHDGWRCDRKGLRNGKLQ